MALSITKSLLQLNEISFKRLQDEGLGVSAGRIAKLILSIVNESVSEFYDKLENVHIQGFLSTATDDASIDMIGALVNCKRSPGEDNDSYKLRISNQVLSLATANETAVRLACLSVEGVEDVIIRPWTHGTGSFSVYVVTDQPIVPDAIISGVEEKVEEFKAYGIKAKVFNPKLLPVEIKIRVIFDKKVSTTDRQFVLREAEQIAKNHINGRNVGESMNPHEIRNDIMVSNDGIYDVKVYAMRVKNRPTLIEIQDSMWNERFVEAPVPNAILVS